MAQHASKKNAYFLLLLAVCLLLCGCRKNPSEEQLYAKLLHHFESSGFSCELSVLTEREVPIYKSSVWKRLCLNNEEEILVYFDESNRADYLSSQIDASAYPCVTRFGLRFVLVYEGSDPAVLTVLDQIKND